MKIIFLEIIQGFLITLFVIAGILDITRINLVSLFKKEIQLNKIKTLLIPFPERPRFTTKVKVIGNRRYVSYEDFYSVYKLLQMIKIQAESEEK